MDNVLLHVVWGPVLGSLHRDFLLPVLCGTTAHVAQRVPAFLLHGSKQQPALLGILHTGELQV